MIDFKTLNSHSVHMITLYTKNRYKKTIAVMVANYVVAN